ncbi:unnamed protein product, partial [Medioppia subpectinata]
KECQKNDWKYHKNECPLYRHECIETLLSDNDIRFWLRLYLSVQNIPNFATKKYRLFDGSDVSLRDIEVKDIIVNENERRDQLEDIYGIFRRLGVDYDPREVVHCIKHTNVVKNLIKNSTFLKSNLRVGIIGRGLYIQYIVLRHSCQPNSAFIFNCRGLSKELRAMRPIAAGEEITVALVPLFQKRADRQQALKAYSIVCECDKCVHHLDRRVDYTRLTPTTFFPHNVFGKQLLNYWRQLSPDLDVVFGQYYPLKTMILMQFFMQLSKCPLICESVSNEFNAILMKSIDVTLPDRSDFKFGSVI